MQSIELIRENLERSRDIVLARVEDMRDHATVPPTSRGGCHTLWVLGHLAYCESLIVREFMLGEPNPLAEWQELFDGEEVLPHAEAYPPFDQVLAELQRTRAATLEVLSRLTERDLDRRSERGPETVEHLFGTYRRCLQYAADHWLMHRGQLADARRAAGIDRMWV